MFRNEAGNYKGEDNGNIPEPSYFITIGDDTPISWLLELHRGAYATVSNKDTAKATMSNIGIII